MANTFNQNNLAGANTFNQNNLAGANTSGDYLTIKKAKAMALTNTNRKRRNNFENNLLFSKGFIFQLRVRGALQPPA